MLVVVAVVVVVVVVVVVAVVVVVFFRVVNTDWHCLEFGCGWLVVICGFWRIQMGD